MIGHLEIRIDLNRSNEVAMKSAWKVSQFVCTSKRKMSVQL